MIITLNFGHKAGKVLYFWEHRQPLFREIGRGSGRGSGACFARVSGDSWVSSNPTESSHGVPWLTHEHTHTHDPLQRGPSERKRVHTEFNKCLYVLCNCVSGLYLLLLVHLRCMLLSHMLKMDAT